MDQEEGSGGNEETGDKTKILSKKWRSKTRKNMEAVKEEVKEEKGKILHKK